MNGVCLTGLLTVDLAVDPDLVAYAGGWLSVMLLAAGSRLDGQLLLVLLSASYVMLWCLLVGLHSVLPFSVLWGMLCPCSMWTFHGRLVMRLCCPPLHTSCVNKLVDKGMGTKRACMPVIKVQVACCSYLAGLEACTLQSNQPLSLVQ